MLFFLTIMPIILKIIMLKDGKNIRMNGFLLNRLWIMFRNMRRKIELEYIFSSSVKVLFSRLSTPAGLSEWFADDVFQKGNQFIFIWNGSEQPATLVELKSNAVVRFRWDDAEEEDEYFEFNIHVEPLTGDVALIITDFADEDEVNDTIELWNKQMDILHRNLGA